MRSIGVRFGLSWLGVLTSALSVSGQSTRPVDTSPGSAQPAAVASTRPASFGIDAQAILEQLASPDWHQRKAATESLVRLGEPAKPFIQELVRAAKTEEARNNAQAALIQIDDNRLTGPSFVTLHLKNATPVQAFAELAPQTFSTLPTMPEGLWQQGGFGLVNIDVDHVPFWEVAPKICQQLGVDFRPYQNNLRIMRGNGPTQGLSHVEGAFLIVANQIAYTRTRVLGAGNREQTRFGINLSVYPEPKITVLSGGANVHLDEVVDDQGNSLVPKARAPGFMTYSGFGGFNLYAALQYPAKNPGKRIARFKGSTTFVVQTKMHDFQIENLADLHELSTNVNGMTVTFHELKINNDQCELHVGVPQSSMSNPQWANLTNQIQTRLRLLDAQGNEFAHRGMGTNIDGRSVEFTIQFGSNNGDRAHKPARLVWEIPIESREITVPIRFTDIPLFEDN
jgi:hypothetical protein